MNLWQIRNLTLNLPRKLQILEISEVTGLLDTHSRLILQEK